MTEQENQQERKIYPMTGELIEKGDSMMIAALKEFNKGKDIYSKKSNTPETDPKNISN